MTDNAISGFLSARICMICTCALLIAGLIGIGAAESYSSLYKSSAPQTALERAELYKALQNPYVYNDPQPALEKANTYKELQKHNAIYSSSRIDDNWPYWANMWLNGPQGMSGALDDAAVYSALSNPYVFNDPQATLVLANTYKELRKYNAIYTSSRIDDNWYYWSNMWLNGDLN